MTNFTLYALYCMAVQNMGGNMYNKRMISISTSVNTFWIYLRPNPSQTMINIILFWIKYNYTIIMVSEIKIKIRVDILSSQLKHWLIQSIVYYYLTIQYTAYCTNIMTLVKVMLLYHKRYILLIHTKSILQCFSS